MKTKFKFFALIFTILAFHSAFSQQIKVPEKKETTKKTKTTPVKETPPAEIQSLKISPNQKCTIKIDGETKGIVEADGVLKVELNKGSYLIEAVCTENTKAKKSQEYTVDEVNTEKLLKIDITDILIAAKKADEQTEQQNKEKKQKADDQVAWNNADKKGTVTAYQEYIAQYPNGTYKKNADEKLENLAWNEALKTNTADAYKIYISSFPQGANIQNARNKVKEIEDDANYKKYKQLGDDAFNSKKWSDAVNAFNTALKSKPNDAYASEKVKMSNDSIAFADKGNKIYTLEKDIKKYKKKIRNQYILAVPLFIIGSSVVIAGIASLSDSPGNAVGLLIFGSVVGFYPAKFLLHTGFEEKRELRQMKNELRQLQAN